MAIQLTESTTSADIIAKFNWRRQNSMKEKDPPDGPRMKVKNKKEKKKEKECKSEYVLCEANGNIGK